MKYKWAVPKMGIREVVKSEPVKSELIEWTNLSNGRTRRITKPNLTQPAPQVYFTLPNPQGLAGQEEV